MLLVINRASPESQQLGEYYARKRSVPAENIVEIDAAPADEIARADYQRRIEGPIAAAIRARNLHDRVLYLVLTKGVPLRIPGPAGRQTTMSSVDSELTLLYRRLTGRPVPDAGPLPNPYYLGDRSLDQAARFTHKSQDIFLVSRLDGFTIEDVIRLIDQGSSPATHGKIVLDQKATFIDRGGDAWLSATADALRERGAGDRVVLEASEKVVSGVSDVLGYYSWGSNDPANRLRHLNLGFVPGSIAATFVSSDGRTFTEPLADWKIGSWDDPKSFFAGSPQSLIGDLIREGATGVAGHVGEPFLDATIRPNILFPAYLSGFNLVESFYLAMPYVSWQTIIVGDPLCAPFRDRALGDTEIHQGVDPTTELPTLFAARRFEILSAGGGKAAAIPLVLKGESRLARQQVAGAIEAFESATAIEPGLTSTQILLAGLYEQDKRSDDAIARYRRVLAIIPDQPVALNNLAYSLAVRKNEPEAALPLAERAYAVSRAAPIADTLAWIHHLLGHDERAGQLLTDAVSQGPPNAEILVHAAIVHAALGRNETASQELEKALQLDGELASRADVKELRARLSLPKRP